MFEAARRPPDLRDRVEDTPLRSTLVDYPDDLFDQVSGQDAAVCLQALQRIADANGGTRVAGSPGYAASVNYVVSVLRRSGFEVITPSYSVSSDDGGGDDSDEQASHAAAQGKTLHSVVAQTRTGDPSRVVMIGAHLDSVKAGPGINDDGSGVAALLEIATWMGSEPAVRNAVRFGFWGSEEDDLQGSTSYVQGLSQAGRRNLMLYLNVDMVAAPNSGYFVQGGTGKGADQTGPPGSATVGRVLLAQLARAGVTGQADKFTGDDDAAFVRAGIPTGGVLSGNDDQMTQTQARAWGGRAGQVYDRCYHSACDTLDDMNPDVLDRFTRALAGTIDHFSMVAGADNGNSRTGWSTGPTTSSGQPPSSGLENNGS